jgi:alanine racemase
VSGVATAHINLNALAHNLELVQSVAPGSRILAVIKANAYGHGLVQAAKTLTSATGFGVARLAEAITLREAGVNKPIVLLEGFFDSKALVRARKLRLSAAVHSEYQVALLEQSVRSSAKEILSVWLKVNSGMNRLGFDLQSVESIRTRLKQIPTARLEVVMSHFSDADELSYANTRRQIDCFEQLTNDWSIDRSIANSGGLLGWPESHYDWVRPGIMLYGISPFSDQQLPENHAVNSALSSLEPVMTLKSQLIAVNSVAAGSAVGYGSNWVCEKDSIIGVVAIGYGDGYSRQAEAGTPVMIAGERCPVVGNVSMDMLTVDLTHGPSVVPGDEVTLWGEGLPAAEVAPYMHTIPYELTTSLTNRVCYSYE